MTLPIALTDTAGAVVQRFAYDAFGGQRTANSEQGTTHDLRLTTHYLYTGRQYDAESGLYYYRNRYYHPENGCFLSKDVFSFNGYSPETTHRYTYCANNPVNRTDPLGLWYIDINLSLGYTGGITGGILIGTGGIYFYGGGGLMTPPGGGSITWSPDEPSPGWNVGLQAGFWGGIQSGYSFGTEGEGEGRFTEFGFVTPGVSLTGFYASKPFDWPWGVEKDIGSKCKR